MWWARPLAARLLPDLRPGSPAPVLAAAAVVVAIAAAAAWLPARVDTIEALREE